MIRPESIDQAIDLIFYSVFSGQEICNNMIADLTEIVLNKDLTAREREYVWERWLTLSRTMFDTGVYESEGKLIEGIEKDNLNAGG